MLFAYKNANVLKAITTDNGLEFYDHQEMAEKLSTSIYFTDAYSSWQKGAIENANKLIRQYFPKDTDFRQVKDRQVKDVQYKLNLRPRKKINFKKPIEVFF